MWEEREILVLKVQVDLPTWRCRISQSIVLSKCPAINSGLVYCQDYSGWDLTRRPLKFYWSMEGFRVVCRKSLLERCGHPLAFTLSKAQSSIILVFKILSDWLPCSCKASSTTGFNSLIAKCSLKLAISTDILRNLLLERPSDSINHRARRHCAEVACSRRERLVAIYWR